MDEARRFLRYVTPGLLFVSEAVILLLIVRPGVVTPQLAALKQDAGAAVVLTLLVASGGLGFLFGTIHHALHWLGLGAMDHRGVIQRLVQRGALQLRSQRSDRLIDPAKISREQAWIAVSSLWHPRTGDDKRIKGADDKAKALTDLTHSLGTGFVASLAAVLVAYTLAAHAAPAAGWTLSMVGRPRAAIAIAFAVAVSLSHWWNYRRTSRLAQQVIDQVLADVIVAEKGAATDPVVTHVEWEGDVGGHTTGMTSAPLEQRPGVGIIESLRVTTVGVVSYLSTEAALVLGRRWFQELKTPDEWRPRFQVLRRRLWRSAALVVAVAATVLAVLAYSSRAPDEVHEWLRVGAAVVALTASLGRGGWAIQSFKGCTIVERIDRGMFVLSQLGATALLLIALGL
jgi:hypothetical protein